MNTRIIGALLVIGALLAGGAAWWVTASPELPEVNPNELARFATENQLDTLNETATPREVASAVEIAARGVDGLKGNGLAATMLSQSVEEILASWQEADYDAFAQMLRGWGLEPSEKWQGDDGQERWRHAAASFKDADYFVDEVQVVPLVIDGQEVEPTEPEKDPIAHAGMVATATIPEDVSRGEADVRDPREARTSQVEVVLPVELTSPVNGERTRARLALIYNRRPSDGKWLLVGARVFDVFMMTPVGTGPIW